MLNKILDILGNTRQLLSSDTGLLRHGLAGLDLLEKGLTGRAAEFVSSGANPAVLQDIRARGHRAGLLLGNPGRLFAHFYASQDDADRMAAKQSLAGRHALYQRVNAGKPDVAALGRLGMVLEAADQGQHLDLTGAPMPHWLHYLLNDALWASYGDHAGARKHQNRGAWDVELIAAIVAQNELAPELTLQIVFERRGMENYRSDHVYPQLLENGALDDYMLAYPARVDALANTLSAGGRVLLCRRIGGSRVLSKTFAGLLLKLAVCDSKTVRTEAACHLDKLDAAQSLPLLSALLRSGQTEERGNAADLLARSLGAAALPILEEALAAEASKPVQQAIRSALSRLQAASDADGVTLPEPPPLPPLVETRIGDDAMDILLANRAELLERYRKAAAAEVQANQDGTRYKSTWQQHQYASYKKLGESDLRDALHALNGECKNASLAREGILQTLVLGGRLEAREDFGLLQVMRWATAAHYGSGFWNHAQFQNWLRRQDLEQVDLRQLDKLAIEFGGARHAIGDICLRENYNPGSEPQAVLPAHRVWPYFAERPDLIDQGLGLAAVPERPGERYQFSPSLGATLAVLATFPAIPARWLPRVMEHALGDGKTHRAAAQRVLSALPDIGKRVAEALESTRQELRIEAARWLASIGYKDAIPALYAALEKESRETVSAAIMTALEQLGEDLSPHLAPARLLAQARKGLKSKAPAGMAWMNLDTLPACRWADGTAVEPELPRWWVVLACKLKDPRGNALLERYLGLLDRSSRAALGSSLLHQWIARDLAHPTNEEGVAWAQAHAPQRHQQYQQWARQYPDYHGAQGKLTLEQVFEEVKREKMSQYLGSAINEKGILALVWGAPGHELVAAIQQYMRDHYQRRAQVEALLEAACTSNEPAVIQFALGIARRYRTASVQEKARQLVERIAERNGWTQDQLADRTIPTGGLDEQGRMQLDYGGRAYTAVLDAAMKVVLHNSEGKVVSALPAPRADDAPESIKEAKQQLAACKKELKQVLDMQRARLYEAMCAGRLWPAGEWREYLQQHPIAGRLVQRLVWQECGADGVPARLFRPSEDGSLIDIADDEVTLADDAQVRLGHGSQLGPDQAKAWLAHFKDYKLSALFAQMTRALPPPAALADVQAIGDRLGWISDTFTLRGAFSKLDYKRGQGEDGGCFFEYTKDFASAGIRVCVEFSGSSLPEENMPAALKTLCFFGMGGNRYTQGALPLSKVPPVLLAEAYGDYHAVAAACVGYDPEWEKKMPW